jgi:hypothetical protein
MDDALIAELSSIPWAAALINDRKWTVIRTSSRSPKPTGEDSFFAETLSTDRTIRSILTFRPTQEEEDDLAYKEIKTIVDLGAGLNGYPQIVHGGFAATLLDEACGILASSHAAFVPRCGLTASRSEHNIQEASADTRQTSLYGQDRAIRRGRPKAVYLCDDRRRQRHSIYHWRGFVRQGHDQAMMSSMNIHTLSGANERRRGMFEVGAGYSPSSVS